MSDWSSFKGDKDIFDTWRDYIYESNAQDIEIDLDEGFMSSLKKAGSAIGKGAAAIGKEAGKKVGLVQDPSQRYRRDHRAAAKAQQKIEKCNAQEGMAWNYEKGVCEKSADGADDQPAADQPAGAQLPKETPLSITKRQPNVKIGPEGQKEPALVMQLQKVGLSQKTSQVLAKRLGQYLQQRKLKVAEAMEVIDAVLMAENLLTEARKQKNLNPKRLSDEEKALIDAAARQADIQPGDWKRVSGIKGLRKGSTLIAVDKDGVSRAWVYAKNHENLAQQHSEQGTGPVEAPEGAPEEAPPEAPPAEEPAAPEEPSVEEPAAPEEAPEAPAEEEPAAEEPSIVDALRTKLKQRDLDSDAGMIAAAKGDEQAYLGAYMYYKSLVKLQKALAKNPDAPADKLIGLIKEDVKKGTIAEAFERITTAFLTGLLTEASPAARRKKRQKKQMRTAGQAKQAKMKSAARTASAVVASQQQGAPEQPEEEPKGESREEVLKWLAGMIAKFKQAGLTDGKRAVAAARAARGVKDTQGAQARDELIAAFGADQTAVGKIIANFISDNQALLAQDPALKKLFTRDAEGNAPVFDQFAQVVKQALAQQLQRRGYKPEEFGNILESVLRETLLESRK